MLRKRRARASVAVQRCFGNMRRSGVRAMEFTTVATQRVLRCGGSNARLYAAQVDAGDVVGHRIPVIVGQLPSRLAAVGRKVALLRASIPLLSADWHGRGSVLC